MSGLRGLDTLLDAGTCTLCLSDTGTVTVRQPWCLWACMHGAVLPLLLHWCHHDLCCVPPPLQGDHGVLGCGSGQVLASLPRELPGLWEVAVTQVGGGHTGGGVAVTQVGGGWRSHRWGGLREGAC
jgi:hypothetical protein